MDRAGILASLCFPTITRFAGGSCSWTPATAKFGFECLQHHNDWLIEGVVPPPGRYIPLMLIPMWDPALAATRDGAHGRPRGDRASRSPRTPSRSGSRRSTTPTATGTR